MHPRHSPRQPDARLKSHRRLDFDDAPARRFVFAPDPSHTFVDLSLRRHARQEDAAADVKRVQRFALAANEPPKRHQSGRVVGMVVAEHDRFRIRQIQVERFQISRHGIVVGSGVKQNPSPVDLDKSRKSPLAEPFVGKHGRQDGDVQTGNAIIRRRLRTCGPGRRHDRQQCD